MGLSRVGAEPWQSQEAMSTPDDVALSRVHRRGAGPLEPRRLAA